ncbi:MAG: group III truncated hemoglobin [Longimicrobiales bacterium]
MSGPSETTSTPHPANRPGLTGDRASTRDSQRPTEAEIRRMVDTFYARVREDSVLGPIFEERIGTEWDPHLDRMVDFWSTVLLASGRYRGDPIRAHRRIPRLEPAHFDRWLELFRPVAHGIFPEGLAEDVYGRALRMRMVLERNLGGPAGARD